MPKAKDVKTALGPKKSPNKKANVLYWLWVSALAVLIFLLVANISARLFQKPAQMKINGHAYNLLVADTAAKRSKGLGGRKSIPQDQAMLFIFNGQATRCFWMHNMQFPLDILWLNTNQQVIYGLTNVSPKTYPETFCANNKPAQYVVELNAGQAIKSKVHVGQTIELDGI